MTTSEIGERLKKERARLKLTQTQLGEIGSVGKTTQINYEKGERNPDASYLAAVAEAGVDVLYVITGRRTPEPEGSLSEDEGAVLDHYRVMPDADRAAVQRLTNALAETAAAYGASKKNA